MPDLESYPARYSDEQDNLGDNARLAHAVGVPMPNFEALRVSILGDLDPTTKGVAWWNDSLDQQRRILIADHLYICCVSVMQNVTEGALHLGEFCDWRDRYDAMHDGAAKVTSPLKLRGPFVEVEFDFPTKNPRRDVVHELCTIHTAGLFRAVASALDCLAAVIVGVEALPRDIFRASFRSLATWLEQHSNDRAGARVAGVASAVSASIGSAGPPGWLDWALDMRHMLVHRGRRQGYGMFSPRNTGVVGSDGAPLLRTEFAEFMPRFPDRSEVQATIVDGLDGLILPGEAKANCRGLLASSHELMETCAESLLRTWTARRRDPSSVPQPPEQWRTVAPESRYDFRGYSDQRFRADQLRFHRESVARFQAAGVLDQERAAVWGDVGSD